MFLIFYFSPKNSSKTYKKCKKEIEKEKNLRLKKLVEEERSPYIRVYEYVCVLNKLN